MSTPDYIPYRFYRICPEDSHTCAERECLTGRSDTECPKAVKATAAAASASPQVPDFSCVRPISIRGVADGTAGWTYDCLG